jgi:hypothetical protein
MTALIPTIKWSQNDEYVIINLEINQVKNDVYEINNNNIIFSGISNTDLNYSINLELLNEINKDESKYILEERIIRFVLKKTEYEKWVRLTKDKNQYKSNIKVNWDSFEDSDEDIEEPDQNQYSPDNQQFDFSNMMNMGNDDNGFNMEEIMKNMNPSEMEELMKSMNMGGNDDGNNDDDNDDEEDNNNDDDDEEDNNDDDNNDDDNNDDDNNDDEDKELDDELNNIINNNDYEEESFDSDDLCQDCVNP